MAVDCADREEDFAAQLRRLLESGLVSPWHNAVGQLHGHAGVDVAGRPCTRGFNDEEHPRCQSRRHDNGDLLTVRGLHHEL